MRFDRRHVLKSLGLFFGAAPAVLAAQEPESQDLNLERSLAEIMSALRTDLAQKWRQAVQDECLGDYQARGITLLSEDEWDERDRSGLPLRGCLRLTTAEYHWDTRKPMDAQAEPVAPVTYTAPMFGVLLTVTTHGSLAAITAAVPELVQQMARELVGLVCSAHLRGHRPLVYASDPVLALSHIGHSGQFSFHVNVNGVACHPAAGYKVTDIYLPYPVPYRTLG